MAFALRLHYRFPVFSPVRYEHANRDGHGTVTNLSSRGWRIHGTLPLQPGDVCSMKVRLAARQWIPVAAVKVRWVCDEECGVETLVINDVAQAQLNNYIHERVKAL